MRRTLVTVLSLAALLVLAGVASAAAADLKIGVLDVEYVVLKSNKGQAAKKKLQRTFERKQKELDKKQDALLELKEQLENPSDLESQEKRKRTLMEYQQGVLKLQEEFVKNQQDLAKKEMELMKPILAQLEEVLGQVAKARDLDIVMNRSQQGVIFAKPSFDLTEEVLEKLNKAK